MLGIWIGKLTALCLKLAGRSATSLPGKMALRMAPKLLTRLGKQLRRCIVVTGTNGKTTTTTLLTGMLRAEGPVVSNAAGANLEQGLVTALLQASTWFGRLRTQTAVLEIDEATLPNVIRALPATVLVVTNVFRDQLDRYGELDTTVQLLQDGIRQSNATVVLNGDDPLARHIGLTCARPVVYYGMDGSMAQPRVREQMRDGAFCLDCGQPLTYDGTFYGQVGLYRCPNCTFSRPHPDFLGRLADGAITVAQASQPPATFLLAVRGLYNMYNALAAIAAARVFGVADTAMATGLTRYKPPTGRMQPFATRVPTVLNLIKNPTGCDSVIEALCADRSDKLLVIGINDLAADGRDVSWLWDADFEWLREDGRAARFITTGLRAHDMALRLKYAGVKPSDMAAVPALADALAMAQTEAAARALPMVHVLTTYTLVHAAAAHLRDAERETTVHEEQADYRPSVS